MGNFAIKRVNDRIFREGSFPDMLSETVTDLPELPEISRSTPFSIEDNTQRKQLYKAFSPTQEAAKK